MAVEQTLGIIKPDAFARGDAGKILDRAIEAEFRLCALKMVQMTKNEAERFYAVHEEKPFFDSFVRFMSSGPVIVFILEGENAIARYRALMGPTNPERAAPETIRARFGTSIEQNAVHGSDSLTTATAELAFFFEPREIF